MDGQEAESVKRSDKIRRELIQRRSYIGAFQSIVIGQPGPFTGEVTSFIINNCSSYQYVIWEYIDPKGCESDVLFIISFKRDITGPVIHYEVEFVNIGNTELE